MKLKILSENLQIHDLPGIKVTITLPILRQTEKFSCGATVMQMIAAYYGINIRELDLIKKLDIKPNAGVKLNKLKQLASDLGFNTKKTSLTYCQIIDLIDNKIPTILTVKVKDYHHFVIPIGYYDDGIVFNDPAKFTHSYLTKNEFENRAYKSNNKFLTLCVKKNKPDFNPYSIEKL